MLKYALDLLWKTGYPINRYWRSSACPMAQLTVLHADDPVSVLSPEQIRRLRLSMRLGKHKFALLLRIGSTTLFRWETGKVRPSPIYGYVLQELSKFWQTQHPVLVAQVKELRRAKNTRQAQAVAGEFEPQQLVVHTIPRAR